jgi:hypothetical protein
MHLSSKIHLRACRPALSRGRFTASRACNTLRWSGMGIPCHCWTIEGLSLLLFYGMTTEEVDRIAGKIREFFGYGAAV